MKSTSADETLAILRRKRGILWLVIFVVLSALFGVAVLTLAGQKQPASATLSGFNAGNIMSDSVMSNKNAMSEAQIQNFLNSKNSCNHPYDATVKYYEQLGYKYHVKNGYVVCMAQERFNANGMPADSGETAARIIWQTAQDYSINPQVLIVLLQKEQSLVSDTWPNSRQYQTATGFGCPDTAPCDAQYYGFKNQLRQAASLFRTVLNGGWTNYPVGNNYVQYNPSASCGGSVINIQNRATSALYRYTPYQPNAAALAAGWGTATCGAYGNRNFYNFFTDWFGSTHSYELRGAIGEKYNAVDWIRSKLGRPLMNESCGLKSNGCYQSFEGGNIYWNEIVKAHIVWGAIRDRFITLGSENGFLGYPTSDEVCGLKDNGCYQSFEGGRIYWSEKTGAKFVRGAVAERFSALNGENGFLGYPTSDEVCGLKDNGCYQSFGNDRAIMWSPQSGAWETLGGIRNYWSKIGFEGGKLGYPVSQEFTTSRGWYQRYQNGIIIGTDKTEFWEITDKMKVRWDATGGDKSWFGYPTGPEICGLIRNGCYQGYENVVMLYSPQSGAWETLGGIRNYWSKIGFEGGKTGYPTGPEKLESQNIWAQQYEMGTIHYSDLYGGWFTAK
jgi:uncharacterized protein with LGFP repeats